MKQFKEVNKTALKTLKGQITKDITLMVKSWYFIIILGAAILIILDLLYTNSINKKSQIITLVSYNLGLKSNIISTIYNSNTENYLNPILLIIPAIIISDDIENKNFTILKLLNFNTVEYVIGKFVSSMILIFAIVLCFSLIGEFYIFYNGYIITSGVIIDPFLVSLALMSILVMPVTFVLFLSSILPNKGFSIISVFLIYPISFEISSRISSVYGTSGLSILNMFLFSISGFSANLPLYLMHSELYTSSNYLKPGNSIFIIELASIVLFTLTCISIFLRKNSVSIRNIIKSRFHSFIGRIFNEN